MKKTFYVSILLIINILPRLSAQNLTSSNLPIVLIDTKGVTILDEPKIAATLSIIYNGPGKRNNLTDPVMYKGTMGIEIRGSSSQMFPKKSYGLEIQDAKGNSVDTTFFGMPKESDWILYASYNEKTLMHNNLTMSLSRDMGMYGSRTQYVEVMLNGSYIGVYVWMEKIKRAKGRVDISKLKDTDLKGDALSGGYIIKIDKTTGTSEGGWYSKYPNTASNNKTYFLYDSPTNIQPEQKTYIHAYIDSLETALVSSAYAEPTTGYRKFLDSKTFAKYFVMTEVTKAVDAYRISAYMYKDKASKGGKLKAGPMWDYDIAYGNANYYDGSKFTGFAYQLDKIPDASNDQWQVPFWWNRLLQDPAFIAEVKDEYLLQRKQGALTDKNIQLHIDSLATEIQEAQQRNFQKWPVLGVYVWPNPTPVPTTWNAEVSDFRAWIKSRLLWLDAYMPGVYTVTATEKEALPFTMEAYPNPFIGAVSIKINSEKAEKATLTILDVLGKILDEKSYSLQVGDNIINLQVPDNQSLSNMQVLRLQVGDKIITKKLVKQ